MNQKKTLAALEKVVAALSGLDPERRRQVIEATHTLLEIGAGRQNIDGPKSSKGKRE